MSRQAAIPEVPLKMKFVSHEYTASNPSASEVPVDEHGSARFVA